MSTEEDESVREASPPSSPTRGAHAAPVAGPVRFWHREHPVFAPLTGFFTGLLLVLLALAALGWLLQSAFDYDVTADPWVLLVAVAAVFAVNVVLLARRSTRRFARYMLFGVLVTPVVVLGVTTLTTYLLLKTDG